MKHSLKNSLLGLLVAQFFGAFNDNAWKLIVALLAIRALGPEADAADVQGRFTLAMVVLSLPLVLFSLPAITLVDRFSKQRVLLAMKGFELLIMVAATVSLVVNPGQLGVPLVLLGMMGLQTALFSPAKAGILPQLLPHARLSEGNGLLELVTFFAIVLGTWAGGFLLDSSGSMLWTSAGILAVFSLVGLLSARTIPKVPAARSKAGEIDSFYSNLRAAASAIWRDRVLLLATSGAAGYWATINLVGLNILSYGKAAEGLGLSDKYAGVPLAACGLGAGIGCFVAGKLSGKKVESGLIPVGALALGGTFLAFALWMPGFKGTLFLSGLSGIASGFVLVPLNALLQWRSPKERRGGVIALSNVVIYAAMLLGALSTGLLAASGLSFQSIQWVGAGLALLGSVWVLWLLPEAFVRMALLILTRTIYRLRVVGRDNIPEEGGALLVSNHVSFVDGLFVLASTDRPVRFIVEEHYYQKRLLRPFLKALRVIPIASSGGPRVILRAMRDAGSSLDEGHLVCIFAEGQITRNGLLLPFRRGLERIVKGREAPILPVYLDRVWGSIFSRSGGRFLFKLPRKLPYAVTVAIGDPLPADTSVAEIRRAVNELGPAAWQYRVQDRPPLHRSFVRLVRRRPWRMSFVEQGSKPTSRFRALAQAIGLARALREEWRDQQNVGILLPASTTSALVNLAAALSGKTSVNLNFTAGERSIRSAVAQAELKSVVTVRTFVEKLGFPLPAQLKPIWLEDLQASSRFSGRLASLLIAALAPARLMERLCGASRTTRVTDPVTILFSSGSTGEPKGVVLTHFNLDSNIEAITQVFPFLSEERLLDILPTFHSFGYMLLWLSYNQGIGIVFHPNPVDAVAIGELVQKHRVTMLLATPTFLRVYLRRCTPGQFGSLRLVLAGAEKLQDRLIDAFHDRFGLAPLQGYGTTECSPVVAMNTLDFRSSGFFQAGARRGTVGHPLPGVAVRVVDPKSREILPIGSPGLLLVKGANVMQCYLGKPELTAKVIKEGWYETGDMATVDEDGFLTITDRLSRFSKIGGEMVPHGAVEEALHECAGRQDQVFAVTSLEDPQKGEKLAVLHTLDRDALPGVIDEMRCKGLPNLFIPKLDQFVAVDAIPLLGTGKLDLAEVKRVAQHELAPVS